MVALTVRLGKQIRVLVELTLVEVREVASRIRLQVACFLQDLKVVFV